MKSEFETLIRNSTRCSFAGAFLLIAAAFCTDWRLGMLSVAAGFFLMGHVLYKNAVMAEVEKRKYDRATPKP